MFRRFLPVLALGSACFAQCSQDMVRGTWATWVQGIIMMTAPGSAQAVPTPAAQLVVLTVDYQGRYTGSGNASLGGQAVKGTFSGTIQVNSDCSATNTFSISVAGMPAIPGQGVERLTVLDNGNEMRGMATIGLLGAPTGVSYYRRISWGDPQCTSDMVHGVYAFTYDGTVLMTPPGQSQVQDRIKIYQRVNDQARTNRPPATLPTPIHQPTRIYS